jgi:hypothetical protein
MLALSAHWTRDFGSVALLRNANFGEDTRFNS